MSSLAGQRSERLAMMLLQTSHEDIGALGREPWAAATELQAIIGTDGSIRAVYDTEQAAESTEARIAQPYWFRCPACQFDWREWVRPSIIFVSLSFITDTCPNCKKRHVPACAKGLNYNISATRRNDSEHHATIEKGLRIDALPERATSDGIAG
jgi:hypothetical protein